MFQLGVAFDAGAGIVVTISMKPEGQRHAVHFLHEQFADATRAPITKRGWTELLAKLESYLALNTGDAMQPQTSSPRGMDRARKAHLAHEKEYTKARERTGRGAPSAALGQGRQGLSVRGPMKARWPDCSRGSSQLVVQHVMFAPDWNEACKNCSFWADGFERMIPHLAARDTTMVAISRAPQPKLAAFKQRMGWTFDWLSSCDNAFNYDYGVSFTPEQIAKGGNYNFGTSPFGNEEAPGISVFYRDGAGNIFHTYSCYARGLDMMNAAYHYLDLTRSGVMRKACHYPMDWVRNVTYSRAGSGIMLSS